ncbi:hypothetical protein [Streptomyces capoamus]|uniref:hypothetical protein n=1 Tax=Streptomyces capoamus TaxID=68183 RepID=UPI003395B0FF
MRHRTSVQPEHQGHGRYTYTLRCSCGAKVDGYPTRGAAEHAGLQHRRIKEMS